MYIPHSPDTTFCMAGMGGGYHDLPVSGHCRLPQQIDDAQVFMGKVSGISKTGKKLATPITTLSVRLQKSD